MESKITGTVVALGDLFQSPKGFRKREVVVETAPADSRFTNPLPFTLKYDDVEKLEGIGIGDAVAVDFGIEGRKWEKQDGTVKYFIDLHAHDIKRVGATDATDGARPRTPADGGRERREDAITAAEPMDLPF